MNAGTTVERRASPRDRQYTPHEHEELRALVIKSRLRSRRRVSAIAAQEAVREVRSP